GVLIYSNPPNGGQLDSGCPRPSNCRDFSFLNFGEGRGVGEAAAVAELVAEKRKLKKSLFRFDMIFFTICAIVALDTIGQSSSFGAQTIFWLIISAATFLIPYGLIPAELVVGGLFIWIAVAMNILSLRYMKWVPNLGAILRLALLVFFGAVGVISGIRNGFQGSLSGFLPTADITVFVGVIGVLTFQWVGFELQTNESEEMENPQRDVPRAVISAGLLSAVGYAIPIIGVILILSSKQLSGVSGFVAGYQG